MSQVVLGTCLRRKKHRVADRGRWAGPVRVSHDVSARKTAFLRERPEEQVWESGHSSERATRERTRTHITHMPPASHGIIIIFFSPVAPAMTRRITFSPPSFFSPPNLSVFPRRFCGSGEPGKGRAEEVMCLPWPVGLQPPPPSVSGPGAPTRFVSPLPLVPRATSSEKVFFSAQRL